METNKIEKLYLYIRYFFITVLIIISYIYFIKYSCKL